mgnify:CR=1 FL=1
MDSGRTVRGVGQIYKSPEGVTLGAQGRFFAIFSGFSLVFSMAACEARYRCIKSRAPLFKADIRFEQLRASARPNGHSHYATKRLAA